MPIGELRENALRIVWLVGDEPGPKGSEGAMLALRNAIDRGRLAKELGMDKEWGSRVDIIVPAGETETLRQLSDVMQSHNRNGRVRRRARACKGNYRDGTGTLGGGVKPCRSRSRRRPSGKTG